MAANDDIRDRIIHREAMKLRFENRLNRLVGRSYGVLGRRLRNLYNRYANSRGRGERLRRAIQRAHSELYNELMGELSQLSVSEKEFALRLIRDNVGTLVGVRTVSNSLIRDLITTMPIRDSRVLSRHFAAISLGTQRRVEELIKLGIRDSVPTEAIARSIRTSSVLRISQNQARSIARTALTEFSTQAANRVYMENADIFQGYQYVATLDTRTTPICSSLDGRVFPLNEEGYRPKPPQHFNCRSTTTPVLKDLDGIEDARGRLKPGARVTSRTRASLNGQVPQATTYDSWLRNRARSTRLMHFDGNEELLAAFDEGVPLDKLVNKRTQMYVSNETLDRLVSDYGG